VRRFSDFPRNVLAILAYFGWSGFSSTCHKNSRVAEPVGISPINDM
jgi:hypothetical protein